MSLEISRFISNPYVFRSRRTLLSNTMVNIVNINPLILEENPCFLINFMVKSQTNLSKKYNCTICFITENDITNNTPIKMRCDCPSFKFEFESLLHKYGNLYGDPHTKELPKKNKVPFTCKHLISCLKFCMMFNTVDEIKRKFGGRK